MPFPRDIPGVGPDKNDDPRGWRKPRGGPIHADGPAERLAAIIESADRRDPFHRPRGRGHLVEWGRGTSLWVDGGRGGRYADACDHPTGNTSAKRGTSTTGHGPARASGPTRRCACARTSRALTWFASVSPIHNRDGEVSGVSVIYRDITEQTRAEEALLLLEERHRALLENSQDAIALTHAGGTIVQVTPSVTRSSGSTRRSLSEAGDSGGPP